MRIALGLRIVCVASLGVMCGGCPPSEVPAQPALTLTPAVFPDDSGLPSGSGGLAWVDGGSASGVAAGVAAPVRTWSYSGETGPSHWADLQPEFATCASGKEQSPLPITSKTDKDPALKALAFQYPSIPLALLNNGHTVQLVNTAAASVTEGAATWKLAQMHFHAPSEHTLDGKAFDAEVHFVHKDDAGKVAVVALFVKSGKENKALKAVLDEAPADAATDPKLVAGATVDLKAILQPALPHFVTYEGSLTAPPCTEGVTWFVMLAPIEASATQIARLHALMPGDTNRPLQPGDARKLRRY
jgi:carbonic anhydrase